MAYKIRMPNGTEALFVTNAEWAQLKATVLCREDLAWGSFAGMPIHIIPEPKPLSRWQRSHRLVCPAMEVVDGKDADDFTMSDTARFFGGDLVLVVTASDEESFVNALQHVQQDWRVVSHSHTVVPVGKWVVSVEKWSAVLERRR